MRWTAMCLIVLIGGSTISCTRTLKKDDYVRHVQSFHNGVHVTRKMSEYVFDLQYLSKDYRRAIGQDVSSEDALEYFTLKIGTIGGESEFIRHNTFSVSQEQQRLYYFSYLFQSDIFLDVGGIRKPCVLFHFQQLDMAKEGTFLIGFEGTDGADDLTVVVDSPHLGSLPMKINIDKKQLPILEL